MKKFLLMTTGGTIASQKGESGLKPQIKPESILEYVQELQAIYEIDSQVVLNMDSSNIQPEEWRIIARQIFARLPDYDGIVVTHGTDTMAYTAAMLSFMLQDLDKPVEPICTVPLKSRPAAYKGFMWYLIVRLLMALERLKYGRWVLMPLKVSIWLM